MKIYLSPLMTLAHSYQRLGMSKSAALKAAWLTARNEWLLCTFTKKNGEQTTRLVYHESVNKQATKGGTRTVPMEYTLHIEVQRGICDRLNDLHPLDAKWLSCKEQTYTNI